MTEKRTRVSRPRLRLRLETLEDRRFLSAAPRTLFTDVPDASYPHAVVGDYRDDFSTNLSGDSAWRYLWNAPVGWQAGGNVGDLGSGAFSATPSYVEMVANGAQFTPDGDANPGNNFPADALKFTADGGHTGPVAGGTNAYDRYAIAAYTVRDTGYYAIWNSFLTKTLNGGDDLEVVVRVADDEIVKRETASPGIGYSVDFDTNLGFIKEGETIYVAVGAMDSATDDSFTWDFSIVYFQPDVVADYRDDFSTGSPHPRWLYAWNAPTGDLTTGPIGNAAAYESLKAAGAAWTPDGNTDDVDNFPAGALRLDAVGGHPGRSNTGGNGLERYAIVGYTVEHSGYYAIVNSLLEKPGLGGNKIDLIVHDGDGGTLYQDQVDPGQTTDFDAPLGFLKKGETVYVAVGPGHASDFDDAFELDFSIIAEPMMRAEPLRTLTANKTFDVASYGAVPDDGVDDTATIQAAINAARAYQLAHGGVVRVDLSAGTYRIRDYIIFNSLSNLEFRGAGSDQTQILVTLPAPDGPTIRVYATDHVILRGFSIDYETLPFTQGTVISIEDANTLVVRLDPGYLPPNDPMFDGWENHANRRSQFLDPARTGRLIDNYDFGIDNQQLTESLGNNQYRLHFHWALPTNLEVGDGWYKLARKNNATNFSVGVNNQLSLIDIKSYASAGGFIDSQRNGPVNVIDSHVLLKPGRLVSHDVDSLHSQQDMIGLWVEESTFMGPSDDVIHVYRNKTADLGAQLGPNRIQIISDVALEPGERVLFYRQDGYRFEANIVSDAGNVLQLDRPISGYDTNTQVVALDRVGKHTVFRDNYVGYHRAGVASLVVWSPNATIIGNTLESIVSGGIQGSGYSGVQYSFYGDGASISDGLIVQGNTFRDTGGYDNRPIVDVGLGNRDSRVLDNEFYELRVGVVPIHDSSINADVADNVIFAGDVAGEDRLAGDADEDGEVAFIDFLRLSANFGITDAMWGDGDFTADGKITFDDFLVLTANFGNKLHKPVQVAAAADPLAAQS